MAASLPEALFLVAAGAAAALVGSAGGITSLISYPALLAIGIAPLPANITNAVALVTSGLGSAASSRPELRGQRHKLWKLAFPAAAGGTAGAYLLLLTPAGVFAGIVPFLIAAASILLLVQPRISTWRDTQSSLHNGALAAAGIFGVSVYGGYFGAGAGVLTLGLMLILVEQNLARANAFKNIVLGIADVITAVVFVLAGTVVWTAALPLAIGAFVGGALGPAVTRRAPAHLVRIAAALSGLGLAAWLLLTQTFN